MDKSYIQLSKEKLQVQKRNARLFRKARRRHGRYTLRVRPTSFGHPSYRGKLTVLVSPMTHSAATMAAVILKRQRGATIVGYQNGGSTKTSCFAPNGVYALPKTKIQVLIPDTCFTRAGNSKRKNKRLPVDIAVDPVARPANELLEATLTAGVEHVLASK